MILSQVTAPTDEPVSLDEAKSHLRVTTADDDTYIGALITAARGYAEQFTGRSLMPQTWDYFLDRVPGRADFLLPKPPLVSVSWFKYVDTNGTTQTWNASNYIVDTDSKPGRIALQYQVIWPITRPIIKSVNIRYVAGYASANDVPQGIKNAMLFLIGTWYNNRETVITEPRVIPQEVPDTMRLLLWTHRVMNLHWKD